MKEDADIRPLLQQWKLQPGRVAGFEAAVWQRIQQRQETRESKGFWHWLFPMQRPAGRWAFAALLVALLAGATAGNWSALREQQANMAVHYVHSLDPYFKHQSR